MLAAEVGGQRRFEVEAETVAAALRSLPVANLVFDERGALRPLVNVYVDGTDVRERGGMDTELEGSEEIRLVAAIAGGVSEPSQPFSGYRASRPARRRPAGGRR
jgi:molybdopterin converting factor small subunit